MIFSLSALWWRRIRGLWKLPDGRDWLRGKLGLVLMGRAMFSKSFIQFSVEVQGCVPSPLFDLRPCYGGASEDNGNLLQKVPCRHCCTQCPQPCSRPLSTHASARDSWMLPGKSGSVSCGVAAPFWVLVHTRFCLCSPRVCPVMCKFWRLYGRLMATSSKRAYATPRSTALKAPAPQQSTADPFLLRRQLNTVTSRSLLGLCVLVPTRYVWALWASLEGTGFESKWDSAPPTFFLGLLLTLGHGVSPESHSSALQLSFQRQWVQTTE